MPKRAVDAEQGVKSGERAADIPCIQHQSRRCFGRRTGDARRTVATTIAREPTDTMVNIDWAQLCELAFIDRFGRLCLIGVTEHFAVPSLPLAVRQLMIAARVSGVQQGEVVPIGVNMKTPGGRNSSPSANGYEINVVNDYALITLWD